MHGSTMKRADPEVLTTVKGSFFRRPVVVFAGACVLIALLALNVGAFVLGLEAPQLLGAVVIADMVASGPGISIASREGAKAEHRTEETEARLGAIVDSAMDAVVTVDEEQRIVLFNR